MRDGKLRIGAMFPVADLGGDPGPLRGFAQAVEDAGYDDLYISEHVLGADRSVRPEWRPMAGGPAPYDHTNPFHDPFVAFGFLAGVTSRVRLISGVLVLGMRQAALVAKQAAAADVLTNGRITLGIGVGWNDVEYEAMGVPWKSRGALVEEQIELMRALWTNEVISFEGKWHKVTAAGINPLPVQRPIPIWIGGGADAVIKRAGRIGDGFYPNFRPDDHGKRKVEMLWDAARHAGRDPSGVPLIGGLSLAGQTVEAAVEEARAWKDIGAAGVVLRSVGGGEKTVDWHVGAVRRVRALIEEAGL